MSRFFIHATNVHNGGGKTLLLALLKATPDHLTTYALLDRRMLSQHDFVSEKLKIYTFQASIWQRLKAEWQLKRWVGPQDKVLCFGNLPPLFKLRGHTVVFVQNRYLIDNVKLNEFALKVRLRLLMERFWLTSKLANVNEFLVQTPSMQTLLERKTCDKVPARVLPFVANTEGYARDLVSTGNTTRAEFDFVYVASGEPHKNHSRLIAAWCLLAQEGLFPSLCLTLDMVRFADLFQTIEVSRQQYGLKVTNMGALPHSSVLSLYPRASAAIYPSSFESFGLPLIEARQAGLPVLAGELDYVRDVLDPEQTFDPESPSSIARAVKRFMGIKEPPLPLLDAQGFLECVMRKEGQ